MRRCDVPTRLFLLVDIDILERNIVAMRDGAKVTGVALRPHAKAHKCIEIAQRVAAAGAIGVCCATIGEAEAMAQGGLAGILITSPLTSSEALDRLRRLLLRGADVAVVADNPGMIAPYAAIAAATARTLPVLVDVDVGMGRAGCLDLADAVSLAKVIAAMPGLHYAGIQAYWGNLQQVTPFTERSLS